MAVFVPYYVAALVLLYAELRGAPLAMAARTPRWPAPAWVAALLALSALREAAIWYAATHLRTTIVWPTPLPIGVAGADVRHPDAIEGALLLVAAAQSYALLGLFRSRPGRALVATGFALTIGLALAAPAFESPDAYAYVGDALLGLRAYAPPNADFTGEFLTINRFFMSPMLPAPYGPLWMAIAGIVTAPLHGLLPKLLALRLTGAAGFAALVAALRAYGASPRAVAIAALNPALASQFVADAHNDVLALAAIVAAAALLRQKRPWIATGAIAVAGLIKLPFVALALPAFAAIASRPLRYACAATAAALAVGISWWGAGAAYFRGLAVHVPLSQGAFALNAAVAIAAAALLVLAFLGARRLRTGVWPIAMASSYVAAWYLPYGLAYALARRRIVAYLLLLLPFACALLDAKFARVWVPAAVLPLAVAWSFLPPPHAQAAARP